VLVYDKLIVEGISNEAILSELITWSISSIAAPYEHYSYRHAIDYSPVGRSRMITAFFQHSG